MEIILVMYFTDIVHSQVACGSKNALVKGACGVGLGFSCQDLLTRFEAVNDSNLGQETFKMQEVDLLGKIVRALSQMIDEHLRQRNGPTERSSNKETPPSAQQNSLLKNL